MHESSISASKGSCEWTEPPRLKRGFAGAGSVRPILLVLPPHGHPTRTLLRALALARVLGAKLHVLRVLPRPFRAGARSARGFVGLIRGLERLASENRVTGAWLSDTAGDVDTIERFDVVRGEVLEQVSGHARELAVQAVVVAATQGRLGSVMTALACNAGVPVLVAREAIGLDTIVAATDLRDRTYPVLTKAADWSQKLHASMIALHNLSPLPAAMGFELDWPLAMLWPEPAQQALSERLGHVSAQLNMGSQAVIRRELHPLTAILHEAVRQNADLVMVGARPGRRLKRSMFGCVASQVVDRATCSVLVLPLARSSLREDADRVADTAG